MSFSFKTQVLAKLDHILEQGAKLMALSDDIKTAFTQETADEQKLIAVLQATLASNKSLADQLAALIAQGITPANAQALLDQVNANNTAMEAEIAAAAPSPPPPGP